MLIGLAAKNGILMTAISSLMGFLALVLANGAGARSQASLGTVVFGGLMVATVLSLLVVVLGSMGTLAGMAVEAVRQLQTSNPDPHYHPFQQHQRRLAEECRRPRIRRPSRSLQR